MAFSVKWIMLMATWASATGFLVPLRHPNAVGRALHFAQFGGRTSPRAASWALAATPQAANAEIIDAIIEQLVEAYGSAALPQIVGRNAQAISSPAFFLRVAELADAAASSGKQAQSDKLGAVSEATVQVLTTMVENAESTLRDANEVVQAVVAAAADADGVFSLPLSAEQETQVKAQLERFWSDCNEAFLQTLNGWIAKADADAQSVAELEGMADVLRRVLQIFVAESLQRDYGKAEASLEGMESEGVAEQADRAVARLLDASPERWRAETLRSTTELGISGDQLLAAVQMRVQMVVLQQANGSLRQRVQAEFLRELMSQLQDAAPTAAQRDDLLKKEMRELGKDGDGEGDGQE